MHGFPDQLDVTQLTSPTLLPWGTDWKLIIYSMIIGFLVSVLLCGGVMIVRGSMRTKRIDRDPVRADGEQMPNAVLWRTRGTLKKTKPATRAA